MPLKIPFKRGDTLHLACTAAAADGTPQDLTGWTVRAQVRDGDALVAELDVQMTAEAAGQYSLRKAPDAPTGGTTSWPVKALSIDVQYTTAAGDVISTETFQIDCKADVTR